MTDTNTTLTQPAPETTTLPERPPRSAGRIAATVMARFGAIIALVVLIIVFSIGAPEYFPTWINALQILNQSALATIIACGLTLILVTNEFDLSIGSQASLAGVICVSTMAMGVPIFLAMLIAVVIGLIIGLLNGLLVTRLSVNALVGTLGVGGALTGINFAISQGTAVSLPPQDAFFSELTIGTLFGIPKLVYYMVATVAVLWVVLNKTDFGRDIRAVGGNREAATLSGVRSARVTTAAFAISGIFAALTGVLLASSVGSAQPTGGDGYALDSFAAAFLGSTVLREGQFHMIGTMVGVLTVTVGFNGLAIMGVPTYVQFLFQGLLLVAAVAFSSVGRRLIAR